MRSLLGRALAVLIAVLSLALAIEQTYRVYLFGWAAFSYARIDSVHHLWQAGLVRASENREIVYELIPNIDAYLKLAGFRTNSAGLRDVERSRDKPPDIRRLAVVGSSFSMPAGVALEDSWHHLVERRLNAHEPHPRYEIVNFAVSGYSARQELAVLTSKAFAYQPELILFELTTHLPYLTYPAHVYRDPYVVAPLTHPFWHSFGIGRLVSLFRKPSEAADPSPYPAQDLVPLELTLTQVRDAARARGVAICFVILNIDMESARNAQLLEQLAGKLSPCVVNTTPAFHGTNMLQFAIYRIDQHPNAAANRVFADVIAPRVARELGATLK